MNVLGRLSVFPRIPERLARLTELANNLWWSWHDDAQALFRDIDPDLWERVNHNPVKFNRELAQAKLDAAAADPAYLARFDAVMARFDAYMNPKDTWFSRTYPELANSTIAYFSAEFGLHEALPIYSGGLGVLSGDHCKTASDLGLPFVGVGFLYPQGYFTQYIPQDGWQQALYKKISFSEVPATPALGPDGREVLVKCELPGRDVYARVWKIQVGRIPLYLMDTDVPQNAPQDRELSARLYGGDRELRISQEYVLGIGGVRAVRALGLKPAVWHMNEGHSAFLSLERLRELVEKEGLTFDEALEVVRASTVFTTHTPVPAGHDVFAWDQMDRFFGHFWPKLGVDRETFLNFARQEQTWGPSFSMTVLAIRCAGQVNGVARLHGEVSREMWQWLYPGTPIDEVPITHITNGVHLLTWLGPDMLDLLNRYLPEGWAERCHEAAVLDRIYDIPDEEWWATNQAAKRRLVEFVRRRARARAIRQGESPEVLEEIDRIFDPNVLILGFARRFATYKRATMIFTDMERFRRIILDAERPVQMLFSGKAHPADDAGKTYIQQIVNVARSPEYWAKVGFIEDYDMAVARYLVQGADVWINTPRRPREASGTSGQKAAMNGNPNLSVLDGWWVEGYNGRNGWAIGEERAYMDEGTQDAADALSLYRLLENEVIPLFYDRDADGIPHGWVRMSKEAARSTLWDFSTARMVQDYTNLLYVPVAQMGARFAEKRYAVAKQLANWRRRVHQHWSEVRISAQGPDETQLTIGNTAQVTAQVVLGALKPHEIAVEIVFGEDMGGQPARPHVVAMTLEKKDSDGVYHYAGGFEPRTTGALIYGVRVRPNHPDMLNKHETGLVAWA